MRGGHPDLGARHTSVESLHTAGRRRIAGLFRASPKAAGARPTSDLPVPLGTLWLQTAGFLEDTQQVGGSDPAQEAAEIAVELEVARKRVCDVLNAPRSTIHAREVEAVHHGQGVVIAFPKRGPRTELSDDELTELIREVIYDSPFAGEGHRKVTARLRREHRVSVGRKRVLRLMPLAGLLAPQPRGDARRAPMRARSSRGLRIFCGVPTRPWRTPSAMAGCGRSA